MNHIQAKANYWRRAGASELMERGMTSEMYLIGCVEEGKDDEG
jgi:hypothetical protein